MVYSHLKMNMNCKVKDNHATIYRRREANKEGSRGMHRTPAKRHDMSKMLKGATKSLASHSFGEIGAVGLSRVLIRQSLLKCTVLWNSLCS